MGTTRLLLYNRALLRLKERELDGLTEDTPARHYLDNAWNTGALDEVLAAGQWKHGRRTVRLSEDPGIEPLFGNPYAAAKPLDWIRTVGMWSDEFQTEPYLGYNYEGGIYYFGITPIFLSYISNHATLGGGNLADWPPTFTFFSALYLASLVLPKLTGNKTDPVELAKEVKKKRTEAKGLDAMENPTSFQPRGSWVRARTAGGNSAWRDRGSRTRLIGG